VDRAPAPLLPELVLVANFGVGVLVHRELQLTERLLVVDEQLSMSRSSSASI
jgi:hypothetical protein